MSVDFKISDSVELSYYSNNSEDLKAPVAMHNPPLNFDSDGEAPVPEEFDLDESEDVASSERSSPPSQKYTLILVGHPMVKDFLDEKIEKQNIQALSANDTILWSRDCRVVLPDNVHLIPTLFLKNSQKHKNYFYHLLPKQMLHFWTENSGFMGRGPSQEYREAAIENAKALGLSHKEGSACIEGGNCRIFIASDGLPKAIIGYNSLLLSLICLQDKLYFAKNAARLKTYKIALRKEPIDRDLIRIGRNVYAFHSGAKNCPITKDPKDPSNPLWQSSAREVGAMLQMTKEQIAQDLGIPLERIAFVFQEQFHIDLELFPVSRSAGDVVFLHDEELMFKVQQEIDPKIGKAPFLAVKTFPYTFSHSSINQRIVAHNIGELEKIGCKAVRVPGSLSAHFRLGETISYSYMTENWMKDRYEFFAKHSDSIEIKRPLLRHFIVNFMNGLYFAEPSPYFITSAPPKGNSVVDRLTNAFKEAVLKECPDLKISFIRKIVPNYLIQSSGGLHCMTSVTKEP